MSTKLKRNLLSIIIVFVIFFMAMIVIAGNIFRTSKPQPVTEQDKFITISGANLRYRLSAGNEPTIIFLHGYGGSLDNYKKIQSGLKEFKSISIDLVGFGASDRPPIKYTLETHRKYLIEFMDKQKIKKAILVGTSMGGSLAAWTASHSSERVLALVMLAPSGIPGSLIANKTFPYNQLYKPGFPNKLATLIVDNWFYRSLYPYSIASQALYVTDSYNEDFMTSLKNIHQPTLLAWSRSDVIPFNTHAIYKEQIPQLEFFELPETVGHAVLRKSTENTTLKIKQFLTHVTKSTSK